MTLATSIPGISEAKESDQHASIRWTGEDNGMVKVAGATSGATGATSGATWLHWLHVEVVQCQ